ncbi:MAG: ATP synthase F1 subunit gamma [Deltaproteobacteria bacterium]|nr:ATP synthase F1 subunit gamma [Deltaproteobacteria bacterium]
MASLSDIRTRIRSVKNTQKITRAMKLVSTAKLRRAQQAVMAARPYAQQVEETIGALAKRAELLGEPPHPLLVNREKKKTCEIIVVTSDRGLCGAFNSNVVRLAKRFLFDEKDNYEEIRVSTVGRRGYDAMRKVTEIRQNYTGILGPNEFSEAEAIAKALSNAYVAEEVDAVFLIYNEFKSMIAQNLVNKQLLPIAAPEMGDALVDYEYQAGVLDGAAMERLDQRLNGEGSSAPVDVHKDPQRLALLDAMLPRYFATELFRALLETSAAEHAARMNAMDSATNNASEMVGKLTLQYNRARQAAITTELMEIIGGSEALK